MPKTIVMGDRELVITPVVEHARAYTAGKRYARREPFETIMTLLYFGDDECCIQGMKSDRFDRVTNRAVKRYLKEEGYRLLRYEHGGNAYVCDLLSGSAVRRPLDARGHPLP